MTDQPQKKPLEYYTEPFIDSYGDYGQNNIVSVKVKTSNHRDCP